MVSNSISNEKWLDKKVSHSLMKIIINQLFANFWSPRTLKQICSLYAPLGLKLAVESAFLSPILSPLTIDVNPRCYIWYLLYLWKCKIEPEKKVFNLQHYQYVGAIWPLQLLFFWKHYFITWHTIHFGSKIITRFCHRFNICLYLM